jgi:carbonic anhydrase/acetyltransferase-like protein (isoleucine patch superfamily)
MPVYALGDAVPWIHPDAFIHPDAVIIGWVSVEAGASVWPGAVLRGDYGQISIGARTSVQDGAVIHATSERSTVIGADCVIGHSAHLEGCHVEDGCLIGSGSILLPDVRVGAGALVGAGAVLRPGTEVPSRARAVGIPASIKLDAVLADHAAEDVALYVANAQRYRQELRRL